MTVVSPRAGEDGIQPRERGTPRLTPARRHPRRAESLMPSREHIVLTALSHALAGLGGLHHGQQEPLVAIHNAEKPVGPRYVAVGVLHLPDPLRTGGLQCCYRCGEREVKRGWSVGVARGRGSWSAGKQWACSVMVRLPHRQEQGHASAKHWT